MATTAGLTSWMKRAVPALIAEMKRRGYRCSLYSGKRSYAQQLQRYLAGHTTVAPWEGSKHQDGEAVDLIIEPKSGYAIAGDIWTQMGGLWGGNFKDKRLASVEFQHFETSQSGRSSASSRRTAPAKRRTPRNTSRVTAGVGGSLRLLQLRARR